MAKITSNAEKQSRGKAASKEAQATEVIVFFFALSTLPSSSSFSFFVFLCFVLFRVAWFGFVLCFAALLLLCAALLVF